MLKNKDNTHIDTIFSFESHRRTSVFDGNTVEQKVKHCKLVNNMWSTKTIGLDGLLTYNEESGLRKMWYLGVDRDI